MKTMQKLVSILLVLALVSTLALGAFAANDNPHTITVKNPDAAETHEYTAYQVFAGTYDEESGALTDVSWGTGVNGTALLQELISNIPDFAACTTAAEVVQVLGEYTDGSDELRAFAAIVDRNLATPSAVAEGDAEHDAVLNVTGDGYYYVKDTTEKLEKDTYSDYMLYVMGNVTIEAKDTTGVTSFKKVKDINDSNLEGSGWQDSADYDIGDPVPFQLTGTVAADYDKYNSYKLTFHDKESAGLTFQPETVKVYVDGLEITEGFDVVTNLPEEEECTFEIRFDDLKAIDVVVGGSVITVEYFSILNENAVIGVPGNPNEMRMEYSNNPTDETSTGFTPWDKVVVFTYEVIIDKVNENNELLPGASFELYKWYLNEDVDPADFTTDMIGNPAYGEWRLVPGEVNGEESATGTGAVKTINGKVVEEYTDPESGELYYMIIDQASDEVAAGPIYLKASKVDSITAEDLEDGIGVPYYQKNPDGTVSRVQGNFSYTIFSIGRETTAGTTFSWIGVDDGWYKLVETEAPKGYNPIDPIVFEIIAEHDEDSEDPKLTSCYGYVNGEIFFTPIAENLGILHANIENHSGAVLPSTGGWALWVYILGALLVVGAGALLVVKKFS